jgi:hypothetical protein
MSRHHHRRTQATDGGGAHPAHIPYWKRAHTDWRFWFGVMMMFAAMIIYVMSLDLAVRPHLQPQPPSGAFNK